MLTTTTTPLAERHFEIIDGALWVFARALCEAGLSSNYYRKERSSGNKRLQFIDHPNDSRYALVLFDSLSEAHRKKIEERFGNPYILIVQEPIRKMVQVDDKATEFYLQYRFNDGEKTLSREKISEYTTAASWLNMLAQADENKKEIKKVLNLSIADFFLKVGEIIATDKISLPSCYRKLKPRIEQYKKEGYACIIHKQTGNKNNLKVNTEIAEAYLLSIIENQTQPDDVHACYLYNLWAKQNSTPQISPATVGLWRRKQADEITIGRYGNSAFNEKFIRQVKGYRPTAPLFLVEHDDNSLDLLYQSEDGYQFNKYVAIVVIDSSCDYVLGKSYVHGRHMKEGFGELMVRAAYLDAMYNIKRLTGGWHLPFELKGDKYASKALMPFYKSVGKFIPPAHGNKHRGYIEQFFRTPLWKRSQKMIGEDNWSGNNMTAKFRGVNQDGLDMSLKEKSRPMIGEEAEVQIENFFHLLRNMPDFKREQMEAPSKEQKWLQAWEKLSPEQKRPISDESFLLTFGIKHNPQGRTIRITNRGVEPQIKGTQLSYDLPEDWMYNKLIGQSVNVFYDPYDLSRVLVTNEKDIRFIARSAQLIARSMEDMKYNPTRIFLNSILSAKKEQVKAASQKSEDRKQIVSGIYNAEAMLQGGVLVKELKNEAEQKMIEQGSEEQEKFMNDNYDFTQFFS